MIYEDETRPGQCDANYCSYWFLKRQEQCVCALGNHLFSTCLPDDRVDGARYQSFREILFLFLSIFFLFCCCLLSVMRVAWLWLFTVSAIKRQCIKI